MSNAIEVRGLSRRLGAVQAVADLDLSVRGGEIVGLLGPNGAGKTSTIEAIAGLAKPDAGDIAICGIDARAHPREARRRTGVVLQSTGLQDAITPREAIALFGVLQGTSVDIQCMLDRVGLSSKADVAYCTLSGGQQQRLALALAFIGAPGAFLFDEPTAGLDPAMRRSVHDQLRALRSQGAAILLATHDLDEAARLCDRVVILDHGRLIAEGPPSALIAEPANAIHVHVRTDREPDGGWPHRLPHIDGLISETMGVRFATGNVNQALASLIGWLYVRDVRIVAVQAGSATLEEVILGLAGQAGPD